jgi:UDP-N-acetylglucosamine transferase subunit ALG13
MIFLTVGTQFPFVRLVQALDNILDEGLIDEEIFAQIGESSYMPRNFDSVTFLEKKFFDKRLEEASAIISHAGMGTIVMALEKKTPLLVMPRLKKYGEVVNDHQLDIVRKFEQEGYILAAYDAGELPAKIEILKSFVPKIRQTQTEAVARRISTFLNGL